MGKHKTKPIQLQQSYRTDQAPDSIKYIFYKTNIKPGDILLRQLIVDNKIQDRRFYKVKQLDSRTIKVEFKKDGETVDGVLSYQQLLGDMIPAPDGPTFINFRVVERGQ